MLFLYPGFKCECVLVVLVNLMWLRFRELPQRFVETREEGIALGNHGMYSGEIHCVSDIECFTVHLRAPANEDFTGWMLAGDLESFREAMSD